MDHNRIYAIITTLVIPFVGGNFLVSYHPFAADTSDSGFWADWCYISAYPEDRPVCFSSKEECKKAESTDLFKSDNCFEHKP